MKNKLVSSATCRAVMNRADVSQLTFDTNAAFIICHRCADFTEILPTSTDLKCRLIPGGACRVHKRLFRLYIDGQLFPS